MSFDVSVVVPVYNAEPFLHECVDSLVNQTLKNVEFIFVDDGSTDRSLEILKEYQKKDNRIRILEQKNQYAGVARNNGMKEATGKYIIFLDSDDFFVSTMLEEAFLCAEKNTAQVVVFDFYQFDHVTKKNQTREFVDLPKGVFSVKQAKESFFSYYKGTPWNKLFLLSFLKTTDLEFQPVKKFNDSFFILLTSCLAERIVFLNRHLVYYRINNSSSLQGNTTFGKEAFLEPLVAIKNELKIRGLYLEPYKKMFCHYAGHLIEVYSKYGLMTKDSFREYYLSVKEKMIPSLFDSPNDFESNSFVSCVYQNDDYESFLFQFLVINLDSNLRLQKKIARVYQSTVSKKSKDYLIGHSLMLLPRKLGSLLKKD